MKLREILSVHKENKNNNFIHNFIHNCIQLYKTDTEEKKLWNKVVIFVFFVHKNILVAS